MCSCLSPPKGGRTQLCNHPIITTINVHALTRGREGRREGSREGGRDRGREGGSWTGAGLQPRQPT